MKKIEKFVIIRTDGGICSQLYFCALGKYFEDRGYNVKYDTSWFRDYGMDTDGIFVRNYDIEKAFKNLNLQIATETEINLYKKKYKRKKGQSLSECAPPIYIDGYPDERPLLMVKYKDYFKKNFVFSTTDIEQQKILNEINETNACAIHVRRGDIATSNWYGETAGSDYFLKAINIINSVHENVKFYFFSDEPAWIKENIVPKLGDINYKICDKNGSDKGYLDLYLISQCKYIVSSNGSLGLVAKLLSKDKTELWMCKYQDFICKTENNIYIINCPNTIIDRENKEYCSKKISLAKKIFSFERRKGHLVICILGIKIKIKE